MRAAKSRDVREADALPRDATGINADKHKPIDSRMPNLPPA